MRPRTILYTGKGGVGKTSVAACTARGVRRGRPADARHLDRPGPQPVRVARSRVVRPSRAAAGDRLWGQEVKAQEEMERHWSGVQEWLGELFIERGVDRISAEELTVPPGMDELFSLLRLQAQHQSGEWDAIIVDCAPTGETLRLLSFPDVARWWIEKVFPMERQILAAARPIARSLLDIPLPSQAVFADIQRLSQNLIAMNEILRDRERCDDPPGDEPGQDGDRRGDADVHLPEPLRVPDRRGDRQPHVPARTSATTSPAGGGSRRSISSWCSSAFCAGAGAVAPRTSTRRSSAPRCSTGSRTRCSRRSP